MSPERDRKQPAGAKKEVKVLYGPISMATRHSCLKVPGLACIYRISCVPLQRHYVGQTTDAARRVLEHWTQLAEGAHGNTALQAAFRQFGPSAFTFSILERLPARYNEATYSAAEQRWLELHWQLAAVFNVRPAGTDNWLRSTKAGRKAGQAAAARRQNRHQGNFHRRNRDHL